MVDLETPYFVTFGNHDHGTGPKAEVRERLLQGLDSLRPFSYSQVGPHDVPGVSNFHLHVCHVMVGGLRHLPGWAA